MRAKGSIVILLLIILLINTGVMAAGEDNKGVTDNRGLINKLNIDELTSLIEEKYGFDLSDEEENVQIVGYTNLPEGEVDLQNTTNDYQTYYVQAGDSLYKISQQFQTTVSLLKSTNNLTGDMIYVGQRLLIPVPEKTEKTTTEIIYFVQPGDSLYLVANRFGTTVEEIVARNNLHSYYLQVGKMLFITASIKDLPSLPGMEVIYYVKPGDTLYFLAQRYNTTVDKIMARNNLLSDILLIGQKLYIPLARTDIPIKPNFVIPYTVEKGDTLVTIADSFEMSSRDLIIFNGLGSDTVTPGQELKIPISVPQNELGEGFETTIDQEKWLNRVTFAEARGEPFRGEVAVAAVVINRVKNPLFPNTVESVVLQPWQFSAVQDGQIWLDPDEHSQSAAAAALKGWDPSRGAIYFFNPGKSTSNWIFYRNVIVKIGDHYFAV